MKRFRRRHLRTSLSFLAMVALLCSQVLLASHPACTIASMVMGGEHQRAGHAESEQPPCHPAASAETLPDCESHCSRGDLSPEKARVLAVPALGPLPAVPVVRVQRLPQDPDAAQTRGSLRSWHRPTSHPASLLLI